MKQQKITKKLRDYSNAKRIKNSAPRADSDTGFGDNKNVEYHGCG